ncbi:MAG TPA: hypothetical protein PKM73_19290 [Verrucomicrobiota bacterium]|nr:hypothetical protein [Verrucomicrobiota bacterium]HNU52138.1 hypothetical protein [Verrucomicrobiota bacterium]
MKAQSLACFIPALALAGTALLLAPSAIRGCAQTPLNLDANPSFVFSLDPAVDPLFTPAIFGLTADQPGFDRLAALAALKETIDATFPPGIEVLVAYGGNPGYALLADTAQPPTPLAAASPLSLSGAFRSAGVAPNIYGGRGAAFMYAEATEVTLGGVPYDLPAPAAWVSPLVLDLDGDGLLAASGGLWLPHPGRLTGPYAAFDIDGDGFKDITEWIGAGDALLTTSPNPVSGLDLLGTAGGWRDGFAQLSARFDHDGNGTLEGPELHGLYLWRDGNANAIAEPGEVIPIDGTVTRMLEVNHPVNSRALFEFRTNPGTSGIVWDWWPNYALALQRRWAQQAEAFLLGDAAMAAVRNILFARVVDDNQPPRTEGLSEPWHLSPTELAAAGVDLRTFRVALLADGGRVILGWQSANHGPDQRIFQQLKRLLLADDNANGAPCQVADILLPFDQVQQVACNPSGQLAMVLGNHGSRLAFVDFNTGTVAPPGGLELRTIGLRASGLAGNSGVKYGDTGCFWFSAWQLNPKGEVTDERVWAVTPWGCWSGLSLDSLRNELGQLRSHFVASPTSGFFAAPTPGDTTETLWAIRGTNRLAAARADSFGGMHATASRSTHDPTVAFTQRQGDQYTLSLYHGSRGTVTDLLASDEPLFYPFLTEGGGTAIAAQLSLADSTMTYRAITNLAAAHPVGPDSNLLAAFPGQGKVAQGAFAHYGPNGIDVLPLPDPPCPTPPVWTCQLLPGSELIDECPIGARPNVTVPMRGEFQLQPLEEDPVFSTYAVAQLAFTAGEAPGPQYKVRGRGLYHVGGNAGLLQEMFLEVHVNDGTTDTACTFTNATRNITWPWPSVDISLRQTQGTDFQTFSLRIVAAPLREVWFSTAHGFHPGAGDLLRQAVSAGDLLSSNGQIVKRNQELTMALGIMPSPDPADLGLDAVDVLPGGEIVFSLEDDAHSETLGSLQHGDLLSHRGRRVASNQELTRAFSLMPPVPDVGLDAVQVLDHGEILFSIETDTFSGTSGLLRHGDVLSSRGAVVRSNSELLSHFHPPPRAHDYGLDTVFVWPGGEIWFSVEEGFTDDVLGPIQPGDLLSDQGRIIGRNRDLLSAFAPLEELADFGLDAMFVVHDAVGTVAGAPPPRCVASGFSPATGRLTLTWEGTGRLYQVEKAGTILGPWLPISPILTEPPVVDPDAITSSPQGFYRLRQW